MITALIGTIGVAVIALAGVLFQSFRGVDQKANAKNELALLFAENREYRSENAAMDRTLDELRADKFQLERNLSKAQDELDEALRKVEKLTADVAYWQRRCEEAR